MGDHKVTIHAGATKNPCDDHAKAIPTAAPVISQDALEATVISQGCVRVKRTKAPKYTTSQRLLSIPTGGGISRSPVLRLFPVRSPRRRRVQRSACTPRMKTVQSNRC